MKMSSGHIIIPAAVAGQFFGDAAQVNWVYYPQRRSLLIASTHDEIFKTLHKTKMSMLKIKNAAGDRSISVQELLLDNGMEAEERDLSFNPDAKMNILTIYF